MINFTWDRACSECKIKLLLICVKSMLEFIIMLILNLSCLLKIWALFCCTSLPSASLWMSYIAKSQHMPKSIVQTVFLRQAASLTSSWEPSPLPASEILPLFLSAHVVSLRHHLQWKCFILLVYYLCVSFNILHFCGPVLTSQAILLSLWYIF